MTLVYGADKEICAWASEIIFGHSEAFDEKSIAIGVIKDGALIAAVVYNNYHKNISIEMSIASVDKRWATRHNLKAFFTYPFTQLNLGRVQTLCSSSDKGVIMFNKRLGFVPEGYHRKAWPLGGDAVSWAMLKDECRWL